MPPTVLVQPKASSRRHRRSASGADDPVRELQGPQSPSAYRSRHGPDKCGRRFPARSCHFDRLDHLLQRHRVHSRIETQAAAIRQLQLDLGRVSHCGVRDRHRHRQFRLPVQLHRQKQRHRQGRKQPPSLEFLPPGVDLLTRHIMPLRNLRHRRAAHPDRQGDPEPLIIAAPPLTFQLRNIPPHHKRRIRHVLNDVAMHVP